jgi:hypothetical protein
MEIVNSSSTFFFDPDSAEQQFVTEVWEPVAPFPGTGRDFTRRILLNHLADAEGTTATNHYTGNLRSPDRTHAEQWFLDGHFKSFPTLVHDHGIRDTVGDFLAHHTRDDGSVQVPVGVYVTTFSRS